MDIGGCCVARDGPDVGLGPTAEEPVVSGTAPTVIDELEARLVVAATKGEVDLVPDDDGGLRHTGSDKSGVVCLRRACATAEVDRRACVKHLDCIDQHPSYECTMLCWREIVIGDRSEGTSFPAGRPTGRMSAR